MLVLIESERAYYLLYGESDTLSEDEKKECDVYTLGYRVSLYRDAEIYDQKCNMTNKFASRLTRLSLMTIKNSVNA